MLADALARNASVVHLIRGSTVRKALSHRKMTLTGIAHTRNTGNGTAAIDATEATSAPFDYNIAPGELAHQVLESIKRDYDHKHMIKGVLSAERTLTLYYEDLLRQTPGSTWADITRHLGVKQMRWKAGAPAETLQRSTAALKSCADLYPPYNVTEEALERAYEALPVEQQSMLAYALADCRTARA